ncbi:MAG: hypothetical protein V6Z86_05025 [Hyphomicrobiales bacterium]
MMKTLRPLTLGSLTLAPCLAVLLVLLALRPGSAAATDVSIPAVPAEVLAKAGKVRTGPASTTTRGTTARASTAQALLLMVPGVNQIVEIAIGHSNRLVTPFTHPQVISSDVASASGDECSLVCVRENVIYVAPERAQPLTMFITEKDAQARAMSLTLIPRRVPPREIFRQCRRARWSRQCPGEGVRGKTALRRYAAHGKTEIYVATRANRKADHDRPSRPSLLR